MTTFFSTLFSRPDVNATIIPEGPVFYLMVDHLCGCFPCLRGHFQ